MLLRTKSRFIMFLFGWGLFPTDVTASHKLWWLWLRRHWGAKP